MSRQRRHLYLVRSSVAPCMHEHPQAEQIGSRYLVSCGDCGEILASGVPMFVKS